MAETYEAREIVSRNPSFNKKRTSLPVKSILRRSSHRPEVDRPDTLSNVSEKDMGALYPEMALRLHSMKSKDITGSTTILPRLQVKDRPPSMELVDNDSLVGTPVGRSQSDVSLAHARRRAFKKNVSFSKDMDDEINDTGSERISDSSSNDDSPLLRQTARDNIGFGHTNPDKIPEHLRVAFSQLQNSSSTDRVEKPKAPSTSSKTPASLSNLFNPPDVGSRRDRPQQSPVPSSHLLTIFEPISTKDAVSNDKSQPSLIEVPTVNIQPPSRFTVSNLEKSNSHESSASEAKNIEKKSKGLPASSLPVENPNKDVEPKLSRFAVTSSAQSTTSNGSSPVSNVNVQLPSSTRFQVEVCVMNFIMSVWAISFLPGEVE